MKNINELTIIYPETEEHLGLWNDIKQDSRVSLLCTKPLQPRGILRRIKDFHLRSNINTPKKDIWYTHGKYKKSRRILVMDSALNNISIEFLEAQQKKGTIVDIYFINSLEASSPTLLAIKEKYTKFNWNNIYTFDPVDAEKYGYTYLGFNYYSKKELKDTTQEYDAYFAGGFKGGRNQLILDLFHYLKDNGVKVDFNINIYSEDQDPHIPELKISRGHWIPYEDVLNTVNKSNCIIELMQQNQNGSSLRYFESICYNKKLLTNNKNIVNYPFYNKENMRIFEKIEDIDIEWLKENREIEYNYNNEFSPVHLVDYLVNKKD